MIYPRTLKILYSVAALVVVLAMGVSSQAAAQGEVIPDRIPTEAEPSELTYDNLSRVRHTGTVPVAPGFLPRLGKGFRFPDYYQLRYPTRPVPPSEPVKYDRLLPIWGQGAVDRGIELPRPFGIQVIGVQNSQDSFIENVSINLRKGDPPPLGTILFDLPFVRFDDVRTDTTSTQLKVDAWVLPFLNVYATYGKVTGRGRFDLNVDLDDFADSLPPAERLALKALLGCVIGPCGSVEQPFGFNVNSDTVSIGMLGAFGYRNWFGTLGATYTWTFSDSVDSSVTSTTVGVRVGQRYEFGPGHQISPYFGVTYLDLNNIVEGFARLRGLFPDGDDLAVRYSGIFENENKYAGIIGFNLGLKSGWDISAEVNFNETDRRGLFGVTKRF